MFKSFYWCSESIVNVIKSLKLNHKTGYNSIWKKKKKSYCSIFGLGIKYGIQVFSLHTNKAVMLFFSIQDIVV